MRKLRVEFRYVDRKTCSRCRTTDKNVKKTVQGLQKVLREKGVAVDFKTTRLPIRKLAQSNSILINGRDIERIIGRKKARSSICKGCSKIMKSACECRTYMYHGKKYSYIPTTMIWEALAKVSTVRNSLSHSKK